VSRGGPRIWPWLLRAEDGGLEADSPWSSSSRGGGCASRGEWGWRAAEDDVLEGSGGSHRIAVAVYKHEQRFILLFSPHGALLAYRQP
jgi:hypothetical protein